jgi:tRNA threonylcarbamoyladenosine biosynthesis protein TsaB
MLTLCIDTAYRYLSCALIRDDEILSSYSKESFRKQSEEVFEALGEVFEKAGVERTDIDSICISEGPGSYTGIRIAMTIAKVIGEVLPCDVYTISTLRLYAADRPNCLVVMDARADRVYYGIYDADKVVKEDEAVPIKDVDISGYNVVGDGVLFDRKSDYGDIPKAFLATKHLWNKVEDIAYLTPKYLKESESYYR